MRALRLRLQAPVLDTAGDSSLRVWQIGAPEAGNAEDIVGGWLRAQGLGQGLYVQHRSAAGIRLDAHLFRDMGDASSIAAECALLSHLFPIMSSVHELAETAIQLDRLSELTHTALDCIPYGVLFLADDAALLGANATGLEILSGNDGLAAGTHGLVASSPAESSRLRQFLAGAEELSEDLPRYHAVPRPSGRSDLQLSLMPVRSGSGDGAAGPDRVVIIVEPDDPRELDVTALVTLLGLTNAEARLLAGLAQDRSLQEQAELMGIKISTARTYLARMLSKTGTRRQSELISLALRSLAKLSGY